MIWDDDEYAELKQRLFDMVPKHIKYEHKSKISLATLTNSIDKFIENLMKDV